MPEFAVEVIDLAKTFGHARALNGLSMKVPTGSVYGLIGPNGAGKTTAIRIILGLLRPDRGEARVFGEDPRDNPRIRERIGVVYEKPSFLPDATVWEYIKHAARMYGIPISRAAFILKMFELDAVVDRRIKELSAGTLQKFAIAHALVHDPELVIADEPTSNLDPPTRSEILDLVSRLNADEGVTFLVSSHILPELSRVCDRIGFAHNGKVHTEGTLDELCAKVGFNLYRIVTDKPKPLGAEVAKLPYIEEIRTGADIVVKVKSGFEEHLYGSVSELARKVGAKLHGIDGAAISLEELFRLAIKGEAGS